MSYDLKAIRQDFKNKGIFYTDRELAEYMRGFLPEEVPEVYDPACGDGGLLSVFSDETKKYGQEINEEQLKVAKSRLKNFVGEWGDMLKSPAFMGKRFKYIIANPPFSVKWDPVTDERFNDFPCLPPKGKADYAFIGHILHLLANDGTAAVLNFPGILYRGNSEGKIRKYLIENNWIERVEEIDGGHFADTKIPTALLIFKKNRTSEKITFAHNERLIEVDRSDIADNEYNLTVSLYLPPIEPKKEPIDEEVLENQARVNFLKRLEAELKFDKAICELMGASVNPFVAAIKKIADKYKDKETKVIDGQMEFKF